MDFSAVDQNMGNVFVENVNVKEIGLGQLVDAWIQLTHVIHVIVKISVLERVNAFVEPVNALKLMLVATQESSAKNAL